MKRFNLFPLIVVAFLIVEADMGFCLGETGTIQGILLDGRDERPLRGVPVRLIGSELEAKTDIKGEFSLTVPTGSYAGIVVTLPMGAGLALLEAEVRVVAGVTEDLETVEVFPSQVSETVAVAPEGGPPRGPTGPGGNEVRFVPWLGLVPAEVPADYGPRGGSAIAVSVDRVFRGSPAEQAGFQPGDFLEEIGARPVTSAFEMFQLINASPLETPTEMTVSRRGQVLTLTPHLIPVPEAALMAIRELTSGGGPAVTPGVGSQPPVAGPVDGQAHPLLQEARRQSQRGSFQAADRAYEEYLGVFPQDGLVWAEYAEMVFHNIQNARGMQLMAQAVKKPGLSPWDKTRMRLIIAQRRLESGNLVTAQQMLIEAKREDPYNPIIDELLHTIEAMVLQASGQVPPGQQGVPYQQQGVQAQANHILVNELLAKIAKELAKEK